MLGETVRTLFDEQAVQGVLHLLNDDRALAGVGQSEFTRGAADADRSARAMTLLIGALTIGLILSLLALGVFISFRIFEFPDITADGSITLGAARRGRAARASRASGRRDAGGASRPAAIAGTLTGVIHTRFGINRLLSGILVMTALYSINLHVMGKSNVPLLSRRTLATHGRRRGHVA